MASPTNLSPAPSEPGHMPGKSVLVIQGRAIRTKRGADRHYTEILNSYFRDFSGGGSFGYDWPTFRLNSPERYAAIQAIRAAYPNLPN